MSGSPEANKDNRNNLNYHENKRATLQKRPFSKRKWQEYKNITGTCKFFSSCYTLSMKPISTKKKAGGIIVRHDLDEPHILVILRKDGSYGFPKGKCKKNESPLDASIRECQEES